MVSANRNEYTVYSVYIYTRVFISKENGVEVMKAQEALNQFNKWKLSGWSKSETPSSEALEIAIKSLVRKVNQESYAEWAKGVEF
jgi:hypothetical protein